MNPCLNLTFQTLQALNIEILDSLQMKASAIFSELPKLFFFVTQFPSPNITI